jgi:hypothetical protein
MPDISVLSNDACKPFQASVLNSLKSSEAVAHQNNKMSDISKALF